MIDDVPVGELVTDVPRPPLELIRPDGSPRVLSPLGFAQLVTSGKIQYARHLNCIDEALLRIAASVKHRRGRNLLIAAPPRHGKSELVSRFFPAWFLGFNPSLKFMLLSYQDKFSASWGRKARRLLEQFGMDLWGDIQINPESRAGGTWEILKHEGALNAVGLMGGLTGKGADILGVDDVIKNPKEAQSRDFRDGLWDLFQNARTRVEPGGSVIVSIHRWNREDLQALILALAKETGEVWEVIIMPALAVPGIKEDPTLLENGGWRVEGDPLWPERASKAWLERQKAVLDRHIFQALFQQDPINMGFQDWDDEMFKRVAELPPGIEWSVMYLDPSKGKNKTSDFSAFVYVGQLGGDRFVWADLDRRPSPRIIADGVKLLKRLKPTRLTVEGNDNQDDVFGPGFRNACKAETPHVPCPLRIVLNTENKIGRIRAAVDPALRGGRIYFVESPGMKELIDQLKDFPNGSHDDGPDALAGALDELDKITSGVTISDMEYGEGLAAEMKANQKSQRPQPTDPVVPAGRARSASSFKRRKW